MSNNRYECLGSLLDLRVDDRTITIQNSGRKG